MIHQASSSFLLKYSPPFLWPGHRIKYYMVLVRDTGNDVVLDDRINTNFSDVIVTFTHILDYDQRQACSKLTVQITALCAGGSDVLLEPFNVTLTYPAGNKILSVCVMSYTYSYTNVVIMCHECLVL